jgi:hypothetical protein
MGHLLAVAGLVTLLLASPVFAQSGSSYDSRGGGLYNGSRNADGSTTIKGSNYGTGTQWNQTITPSGDQQGTDSRGSRWNYNNSSGRYWDTDGKSCWGKGLYRQCN